jgi:hypothetical protein
VGGRQDVYALSLGDAPTWSSVAATGPAPAEPAAAAFDPVGHRLIVLTYAPREAAQLFALELGQQPKWHRFCAKGMTPAGIGNKAITLVPDGLFLSAGGGAFRFNLSTAYCDE